MLAVPAVVLESNGIRSTAVYILLYYVYFRNRRVKTEIHLCLFIHNDLHWIQGIDLYHIVVSVAKPLGSVSLKYTFLGGIF